MRGFLQYPEVTVDTTVEVDPAELHEQGWHHEDECGTTLGDDEPSARGEQPTLYDVAQEMHRQLHPNESLWLTRCTAAPCSDLKAVWG